MTPEARKVWRNGIAPQLRLDQLKSLKAALERDDPKIIQGACMQYRDGTWWSPVVGTCAIVFNAWNDGVSSDEALGMFFNEVCQRSDRLLQFGLSTADFISWFDSTPREEMRKAFIAELAYEIEQRELQLEKLRRNPQNLLAGVDVFKPTPIMTI